MTAVLILIVGIVLLGLGYVFYGSWLAKKWGVNPDRPTPAHTKYDNKDFVPTNPAVLMGHHFSSIAGAGPINGPIQAAIFGWVPVFLWIVIGGIFFGGMHDFGALLASIRHGGRSIGEVIKDNIGDKAYKLFVIFALLVLILVIASFTSVVAGTFVSVEDANGNPYDVITVGMQNASGNASTATTSLLFIVLAVFFGYAVYRRGVKVGPATIVGVIGIIIITIIGLNVGINLPRNFWVIFIAVYITLASLLPVWILLQPRDYLSSFLLYGMMILAIVGVLGGAWGMDFQLSAFEGFAVTSGTTTSYLFPTLFITVACGAISGFHSLVGSGTSSKQINSEKDAKVIGYGAMIVECILAILSLIAAATVWHLVQGGENSLGLTMSSPPTIFAGGLATLVANMTGTVADFSNPLFNTVYTLLTLAVSVFALTSLDTGTRLGRYMFTELFVREGEDPAKITGFRGFLAKPVVGTIILVAIGCSLGYANVTAIWALFGAANQLLAGLALMAVACWLGNIGKSNKMFFIPMVFMMIATLTSLVITVTQRINSVMAGGADWTIWFQLIFAVALIILAVVVSISGIQTFAKQAKGVITGDAKAVEATK